MSVSGVPRPASTHRGGIPWGEGKRRGHGWVVGQVGGLADHHLGGSTCISLAYKVAVKIMHGL